MEEHIFSYNLSDFWTLSTFLFFIWEENLPKTPDEVETEKAKMHEYLKKGYIFKYSEYTEDDIKLIDRMFYDIIKISKTIPE